MISGLTVGGEREAFWCRSIVCGLASRGRRVHKCFPRRKAPLLHVTERSPLTDRLLKLNQFPFLIGFIPAICDDSLIHVNRRPAHVMTMKAAPEVNLGCDLSVVAGVGLQAYVTVRWRACVPECGGKNWECSRSFAAGSRAHDPSIHPSVQCVFSRVWSKIYRILHFIVCLHLEGTCLSVSLAARLF